MCKVAFLGLHGIKSSRLKKTILKLDISIEDGRGKHEHHLRIDESIENRVREHIRKFPARESHYSRTKNVHERYRDSSLTVASLHRSFIGENPDLEHQCSYRLYSDIFNTDFNISFGFPRSDICDTCEKHQAEIKKAQLNGNQQEVKRLEVENKLHQQRADVFNIQLTEATENASALGENRDTVVICMDYERNLPLPLTGIGQEYYKRQLWVHNFCITWYCNNQQCFCMQKIMLVRASMKSFPAWITT